MDIEFEAKFPDIDKDKLRKKLKALGAVLVKPEFFQKRVVFFLPKGHEIKDGYLRVRDEGDRITMSLKVVNGDKIQDQKEIMLIVDDFENSKKFLLSIGCIEKAYQETKRELWKLDGVEITLDEWPFLEPFIEIEGISEEKVKEVSEKLGFDWEDTIFGAVDVLINKKYGVPYDVINKGNSQYLAPN
ncbi:hypothetical protein A3D00_01835 [Candidatus Woesebacteria bacterium RIFCSPHIGHO2_02_FULL_38_9]|uniref:CYTH domain-containing protein n=1 Tax=Candidatus Woesebacteria bacterium RIFCSPHIGHO2_01_FULL_39_28 TaxID=1802496 RepID=A0A1F7YFK2_9BACT|nr:MAG: hypothetical protein A2627_03620 [Candidatus Woesebacteria bacterium RIFCSPHIGHO2_01_FULL_39_28]OGM33668.1 MAG: hypothetical protein A3D00_01835 [Candidatus Woesebacteria bacterium RIFCSPHIGHO2_02_FULL_38_9]OGM58511.1 MAG: hypothetical protein A3A50_00630 [Candidatus Woesebacteria bacterium RIFCSPLOWO2_01_FULL_38_20]